MALPMAQLPRIEVRYTDLDYSIKQSATTGNAKIATVGSTISGIVSFPFHAASKKCARASPATSGPAETLFPILSGVSGVLRPGTLTLLLAPPGHGKSSLMKALTQQLHGADLKGAITYSGAPSSGMPGVHLGSLCQYVQQVDEHLPQLTVRETLEFIHQNCSVDPEAYGLAPTCPGGHAGRVQDIMDLLHLEACKNTVIGNDLVRGVSGGEKKRVTVAEGLLTEARFLALDEISTGLDSAVTFDIVRRLRSRANDSGLTVIVSLLQPTPETYALFDEVLLMREGAVVYHGAREALPGYLRGLGFPPPCETAEGPTTVSGSAEGSSPASLDLADWLLQMLSDPAAMRRAETAARLPSSRGSEGNLAEQRLSGSSSAPNLEAVAAVGAEGGASGEGQPGLPATTAALAAAWRASPAFAAQMSAQPSAPPLKLDSPYAVALYGRGYVHGMLRHLGILLGRQWKLMVRNMLYMRSRVASAAIMSIVLGGLYYQRTASQAPIYFGTFLNSLMIMGFSNMSEMSAAVENKFIAYRHVSKGVFPPATYVLASALLHVPVALVETLLFCGVLYGMSGMVGNFGVYWFTVFVFDLIMRNLLVFFTLKAKTLLLAQAAPMPIIALMILFGGFLITRNKMGWLTFVSYIDPIAYGLRSLTINELTQPRYSSVLAAPAGCADPGPPMPAGLYYLTQYDFGTDTNWIYYGWAFNLGFLALCLIGQFRVFDTVRIDRNIGSARASAPPSVPADAAAVVAVELPPSPPPVERKALPLMPMTVGFLDITYTVRLQSGEDRVLLNGIQGYALPGRILGLMGASGAGKTTLLDVLGGRKNSGTMKGDITLNGFPKEDATFNRITAYVEQNDIQHPLTTVREALLFSAGLRLPPTVDAAQRTAFVDEILDLLELRGAAHRLVGRPGEANALAPHERKRLTIGVELVSNAPVLFLDEPTSGLDSRAAAIVMRVVRNVASTGRTVICTVHQPSAELFYFFDDLLLLQRGGWQVFFGPIGHRASELKAHLGSQPGVVPCPPGMNPASWMLDSLQGMDSSKDAGAREGEGGAKPAATPGGAYLPGKALQDAFFSSERGKQALAKQVDVLKPKSGDSKVGFTSRFAVPFTSQLAVVLQRQWLGMYRNVGLNFGRLVAMLFLNLLFGTIWYKIAEKSTDQAGVQSLVSAVFMSAAFGAMINMTASVPVILQMRSVFYRESNSEMYMSPVYALSFILCELPWLALIMWVPGTMGYFMYGLIPTAASWAFHHLVCFLLATVYISMGTMVASIAPTFEVAQAILGLLGPLFFLFGGLWSPPSQMFMGAKWFCYIDPIYYAFKAIIPQQFVCSSASPGFCNDICIAIPGSTSRGLVPVYTYVSTVYELTVDDALNAIGYLALFILAFQAFAFFAMAYVRHILR